MTEEQILARIKELNIERAGIEAQFPHRWVHLQALDKRNQQIGMDLLKLRDQLAVEE